MSDSRWDFENERPGPPATSFRSSEPTSIPSEPVSPRRPPVSTGVAGGATRTVLPPSFTPPVPLPDPPAARRSTIPSPTTARIAEPSFLPPAGPPPAGRPAPIGAGNGSTATTGPADRDPAKGRWGWRAVVAFLAGGLIAGGAFTAGTVVTDDGETATAIETVPATSPTTLAPAPSVEPAPAENPAAFVAEKLGPSVVQIVAGIGSGSGVAYRDGGYILTNNHVIEGSDTVFVIDSRGRTLEGSVIGSDPRADIAVIQVEDLDLPVADLALDQPLAVGQTAIAIGSPFELTRTVTAGIVSSLNRPLPNADGTFTAMIQTDAPINPGNSGGPLADRNGRVIGINTAIRTDGVDRTNAGVGFAVPIDTAHRVAERILRGDTLEPGFLGVGAGNTAIGEVGVVIDDITPGSGAEAAGLRSGDRVLTVEGAPVTDFFELAGLITNYFPGDEITLEVARGDTTETLTAVLGERP